MISIPWLHFSMQLLQQIKDLQENKSVNSAANLVRGGVVICKVE